MNNITKNNIETLFNNIISREKLQEERKELQKRIEDYNDIIKHLLNNPDIKTVINNELQKSIDKNKLNEIKGKVKDKVIQQAWSCYNDGKSSSGVTESTNPRSEFIPSEDEYEIVKIESVYEPCNSTNLMYKVIVDNVKGRQFMNPFMWIPDYYETDWFNLDNILKGK